MIANWVRSFNGAGMFLSRKSILRVNNPTFQIASMGPGCFYPGNVFKVDLLAAMEGLQWGRDVSIPEMVFGLLGIQDPKLLQWGRDVSIPEMVPGGPDLAEVWELQWGRDVSIPEMSVG